MSAGEDFGVLLWVWFCACFVFMGEDEEMLRTIWDADGRVMILDQTLLPVDEVVAEVADVAGMHDAIRRLCVRGAPCIGIAAAYGVWLAARDCRGDAMVGAHLDAEIRFLATARPTAVNLFFGLERQRRVIEDITCADVDVLRSALLESARAMVVEDDVVCRAIGRHGAELLTDGMTILTHCNAGGLATAGVGTALAPVYYAVHEQKKDIRVFADETRPLLQGARLTAFELLRNGIDTTLICDNMAGFVMQQGKVQAVIVGTDRVAANGDFANKIGTYSVAVLAAHHGIPFYVAAPFSSIDFATADGGAIPIEEREAEEVCEFGARRVAPEGVAVYNPAFDVTPAQFVTAFITEKGIIYPPFSVNLKASG